MKRIGFATKGYALLGASVLAMNSALATGPAKAQKLEELEAQVQALSAQIQDLKSGTAAQLQEQRRQQAASPQLKFANGRPTFESSDGQFSASLRGRFHFDFASYLQDEAGPLATDFRRGSFGDATEATRARDLNTGVNFRRAQVGLEGKIFGDWTYSLIYEFGGSGQEDGGRIQDLFVQYNGFGDLKLRVGAFAPSAGFEDSVSSNDTLFIERASASDLSRQVAGADGRTGIAAFWNDETTFASLVLTGASVGTQSFDEQAALVGRVAALVYKSPDLNVHLGANATWLFQPADAGPDVAPSARHALRLRDRPEIRVDGTRLIDTGNIATDSLTIPGVEFAANFQNLYLQAEHFWYLWEREQIGAPALPDPSFSGWYVQGSWILTGETRAWNAATGVFAAPRPAKPFSFAGDGLGAWELAARYSVADLNSDEALLPAAGGIRGGEQRSVTVGVNWYVNNNVRFLFDYQAVEVDRLSTGVANAYGTGVFTPPAGAQIGQDLDVISVRTQLTF